MDERVVSNERAGVSIELGSVIGGKYTILRPEKAGLPDRFVCRETGADPLRSVWAFRPRHTLDPQGEAFLAELAKVAKLAHPQLQKVLDFGRDPSGILYSVYEPIELRNIAQLIEQDWPLADERVVWLMCQLLATLEAAHAEGVVHGDVRPENVLVRAAGSVSQNEEILLCGLGLSGATRYEFSTRATQPQLPVGAWIVGTPQHAAPEQLRGVAHDARSDVYAAGLLLFQMLTRTVPFAGANDVDTAFMQCFTPPPPPSGYGPVSSVVEAICLKALAKTPDLRYQSVNELRGALLAAQAARTAHTTRLSKHPAQSPAPAATTRSSSSGLSRVSSPGLKRTSSPGLSRVSRPSVPAVAVVAPRRSQPDASARAERTSRAPEQTPRWRQPSAPLLLTCSALAIAAALILPDLKLRETDSDAGMIIRGAPAATSTESLPVEPALAQESARASTPPSAASVSAPAAALPAAIAPRVQAVKPAPAPAAAPSPRRAQPTVRNAVEAVGPSDVRVDAAEKTVIAEAAASDAPDTQKPVVAIIARRDEAEDSAEPATAPAVEARTTPAADPSNRDGAPIAVATQAAERSAPQPTAAPIPSAPVAVAPVAELPRPIVLANTAPKSPSPSAPVLIARDVRVVVGEARFAQGAVSKNGLRSALNQTALAHCYLDAAQSGNPPARNLQARLELGTNMAGRIVTAKLSGSGIPASFTRCVEDTARLGRVRDADTGEARATLELSFVAE